MSLKSKIMYRLSSKYIGKIQPVLLFCSVLGLGCVGVASTCRGGMFRKCTLKYKKVVTVISIVKCNKLFYCPVNYNDLGCKAVQCCIKQCNSMLFCSMQYNIELCSVVQCCIVQ